MKTIHDTWRDDPSAVTLIDAHHHFWDLKHIYYPWLTDQPVDHFFIDSLDGLSAATFRMIIALMQRVTMSLRRFTLRPSATETIKLRKRSG